MTVKDMNTCNFPEGTPAVCEYRQTQLGNIRFCINEAGCPVKKRVIVEIKEEVAPPKVQ